MHGVIERIDRLPLRGSVVLALAILLIASPPVHAQFPPFGGMGPYGYGPGWGYGGYYGYPLMGPGYGGYGYGYPWYGYGYPGYGFGYGYAGLGAGYYGGYGYPGFGYGYAGVYSRGLVNPLFGTGLTPLGVQSYLFETQGLGRRPRH
jgi:hypothetical protein